MLHALLEGHRSGNLECHFGRVDVVVLPVLEAHAKIDDRITGQESLLARVLNALLHRGNVLARNRAAKDLVDEFEVAAARQRLHRDLAIGELSVSARLLLVTAVRLRRLRDRLAIRNFRRMEDHVDAVLLLQLLHDDLDVELPLSADLKLLGHFVALELDGRIFFDDASDRAGEFVFIAARFRFDGECDRRLRIVDVRNDDGVILRGDRVTRVHVLELRHRSDVSGAQLRDRHLLFSLQQLKFADALFVIARRVPVRRVRFERSGVDAEQRYAA